VINDLELCLQFLNVHSFINVDKTLKCDFKTAALLWNLKFRETYWTQFRSGDRNCTFI